MTGHILKKESVFIFWTMLERVSNPLTLTDCSGVTRCCDSLPLGNVCHIDKLISQNLSFQDFPSFDAKLNRHFVTCVYGNLVHDNTDELSNSECLGAVRLFIVFH